MLWKNIQIQSKLKQHWPFYITAPILAVFLIFFWYLNDLSISKNTVLNNPNIMFAFIIIGSFLSACCFKEFSIKLPKTYTPLIMGFVGGMIYGLGAKIASLSIGNVVIFGLFGIFVMPSFLLLEGFIFIICMFFGGLIGSKLYVVILKKTYKYDCKLNVPNLKQQVLKESILQIIVLLLILICLKTINKIGIINILSLLFFGIILERGTLCLSAMMKEIYIAKTSIIWKSVIFTIMILSILYNIGVYFEIIPFYTVKIQISHLLSMVVGSCLIGFGYIFSDGCGMGNLWKIGQGNVINMLSFIGSGIGFVIPFKIKEFNICLNNYLGDIVNPWIIILIMWTIGLLLLNKFKSEKYEE